MTDGAGHRI